MAGTFRRQEPAVAAKLFAEGYRFDFYQAVRLLELLRPGSTPLGEGTDPQQEAVRLRSAISFAFPPSDVAEVKAASSPQEQPELTVNHFGLAGGHGPLPHAYSELILERLYRKDAAARDFLDLFHHRLLSIAYRIYRAHHIGLETTPLEEHTFASYLYALLGIGTEGLRGRMGIPDRALLRYAGLLHKSPRDAAGLERLLSDYFGIGVRCEPYVGAFHELDAEQRTSLGESGQNRQLGVDTMLGGSVWDQQAGVHLHIGPLRFAQYQDFLPGRPGCVALCSLCRFYLGPKVDIWVSAKVSSMECAPLKLGSRGDGSRLGWTSWLLSQKQVTEEVETSVFYLPQFQDLPHVAKDPEPVPEPAPAPPAPARAAAPPPAPSKPAPAASSAPPSASRSAAPKIAAPKPPPPPGKSAPSAPLPPEKSASVAPPPPTPSARKGSS